MRQKKNSTSVPHPNVQDSSTANDPRVLNIILLATVTYNVIRLVR
jgi:hypothetical protein